MTPQLANQTSPIAPQAPQAPQAGANGGRLSPMVKVLGLKELLARDAAEPDKPHSIDDQQGLTALAGHIRHAWGNAKLAKQRIDLKLLACLRARRGIYGAADIAASSASGMNLVWADLTETKCRAASAWIREIVMPVGEQPWGFDPTPIPELPRKIQEGIVQKAITQAQQVMQQNAQAGGMPMGRDEFRDLAVQLGDKMRDEAEKAVQAEAGKRAKRMERQIADRLDQGDYEKAIDGFVEDFVTYPAAILKGPIYKRKKRLEWGAGWKPLVDDGPVQTWERVSPFDVYPSPNTYSPQKGDFIERIRFQRSELYDLKDLPGYKNDQIDSALLDYSNGHLEGWLWTEAERQRLEQESLYMWISPPGVIDALSYWGSVPGWKLMSWGIMSENGKMLDETREYECNVLLCGRYILYAALNTNPLGSRPYRKACYDEMPGAFWGRSIPDLCMTSQKMCNGIASALADNVAMASGPMVWVHADRFADGEDTQSIFPWRLWQLKSDASQGVNPGIGFFQPNMNADVLMATYEKWEIRADDATGIPRYTYGNERAGGSADTATGLSMLMNNAAKGLRRAIGSIDLNVISMTIYDTFVNEMLYNPDQSIKGDCIVVPRGAAAILIKESAQQRRMQFLQITTANPIIAQLLGPKYIMNMVRDVASAMELPEDSVPTPEEVDQKSQADAQAAQDAQKQQLAMIQATEQAKAQANTQGQLQLQNASVVTDIVKQSIEAAMSALTGAGQGGEAPASSKATA